MGCSTSRTSSSSSRVYREALKRTGGTRIGELNDSKEHAFIKIIKATSSWGPGQEERGEVRGEMFARRPSFSKDTGQKNTHIKRALLREIDGVTGTDRCL